jgi:hypothetical protein
MCQRHLNQMGSYQPLDGVTNLKYKLLYFLTQKNSKRKALAFNRDRWCHLAICLQLILFHYTIFFSEVVDHGNRVTENGPDIRGRVGTPGGNVEKLFFHH